MISSRFCSRWVLLPLGFATDDESRFLWSEFAFELLRSHVRKQIENTEPRILLEASGAGPDQLSFVFRCKSDARDTAHKFVQKEILEFQFDENLFETQKESFLEEFETKMRQSSFVVEKLAPAAFSSVYRFGTKKISILENFDGVTHEKMNDYLQKRIRSQRPFIGEFVDDAIASFPEIWMKQHFELVENLNENNIEQKNPFATAEHRSCWDLPYHAIVECWTLPDPAKESREHVISLFALRFLTQKVSKNLHEYQDLQAVHCGTFLSQSGLCVYLSTLWNPDTKTKIMLENYEKMFEILKIKYDWNALYAERGREFEDFVFNWGGSGAASFTSEWSAEHFRYNKYFQYERQYRLLQRDALWLSLHAIEKETLEILSRQNKVRVLLHPCE